MKRDSRVAVLVGKPAEVCRAPFLHEKAALSGQGLHAVYTILLARPGVAGVNRAMKRVRFLCPETAAAILACALRAACAAEAAAELPELNPSRLASLLPRVMAAPKSVHELRQAFELSRLRD